MAPRVSIIILNWNGWSDTIECLESVYRIDYPNYDVIVVDNASQDTSIQKIKEYAQGRIKVNSKFFEYNPENKPIKVFELTEKEALRGKFNRSLYEKYDQDRRLILIKNMDNYGFAGGNNVGIKFALSVFNSEYVLILNNDTVVARDFLSKLVDVIVTDTEQIGIIGPVMYYYDDHNIPWFAGGEIYWWKPWVYYGIHDNPKDAKPKSTKWISGAALMINTKYFRLLNTKYFFGNEDVELGIKARKQNLKVLYVSTSRIWHKVGATRKNATSKIKVETYVGYFDFVRENFSSIVYTYQIVINTLLIPLRIIKAKDDSMIHYLVRLIKNANQR